MELFRNCCVLQAGGFRRSSVIFAWSLVPLWFPIVPMVPYCPYGSLLSLWFPIVLMVPYCPGSILSWILIVLDPFCPGSILSWIPIVLQHLYMSNIYIDYIQYAYMSKNTVLFKKWTCRWSLDIFMDSKLINFQNDLIFWPLWGPEILFLIDFLTILIFRKNIFLKYFLAYLFFIFWYI